VRSGAARSVAEFVRLAVREYAGKAGVTKLLNLRDVPLSEARRVVERYLREHSGAVWPDEMAERLGLDYRIVLAVVRQLLKEDKIEETSGEIEEIHA
jgi:hypothetical protein